MQARKDKYPARSVYKLKEIQQKNQIIQKGSTVLDLGCAPGAWLKYTAEVVGPKGRVVGIDLKPVTIALPKQVQVLTGDIFEMLDDLKINAGSGYQVVLSDMAPATTGNKHLDAARSTGLCEAALFVAQEVLKPGGRFVCKIFQGPDFKGFTENVRKRFKKQKIFKPRAAVKRAARYSSSVWVSNRRDTSMSGHSKWSTIKHKKAATDAKRGKIFTRLIKEITIAARMGGGDPDANPRLRAALAAARAENMPKDNIERAVKKGTGELEGVNYEEVIYEGYGPGGAAVLVESLTDNKNRTVADVRHIFSKAGGNLGESGCVSYLFDKKGYLVIEKSATDEDTLMEVALDAGAEDVREDGENFEVITEPGDFELVRTAIETAAIDAIDAEITMLPQTVTPVAGKEAEQMVRLMESLEDCDDVQKVYTNADLPDDMDV